MTRRATNIMQSWAVVDPHCWDHARVHTLDKGAVKEAKDLCGINRNCV